MQLTTTNLYVFGSSGRPRLPRLNRDVYPDAAGMIGPEIASPWHGASTFASLSGIPLTGHYHKLPAGTPLPAELGVVADGIDVDPASSLLPTHHTIYPTVRLHIDEFMRLFLSLPWEYVGQK